MSDATNRTDVDEPPDVIKSEYLHMLATSTRSLFAPPADSHTAAMRVRFLRDYTVIPDPHPTRMDWYYWSWQELFRNALKPDVCDL